ncbi:MAG TPA: porin, partial [Pararobbsia sp.]|nr:porin [Pararobbsia sp.]
TGELDWDRTEGTAIANTIKYQTPTIGGFWAGAMYGFGNVAGSVGAGNSSSFGMNYQYGPALIGAAYTNVKYIQTVGPQVSVRNWGAGGTYQFTDLTLRALVTTVHNSLNGAAVAEGSVSARWLFHQAWQLSGEYMYLKGNQVVDNNHANQLGVTLAYLFSKRTTVYASAVYQKANSGASAEISGITDPNPG